MRHGKWRKPRGQWRCCCWHCYLIPSFHGENQIIIWWFINSKRRFTTMIICTLPCVFAGAASHVLVVLGIKTGGRNEESGIFVVVALAPPSMIGPRAWEVGNGFHFLACRHSFRFISWTVFWLKPRVFVSSPCWFSLSMRSDQVLLGVRSTSA